MLSPTLYREIDALGGVPDTEYEHGYSAALEQVLVVLGRRGFTETADAADPTVPSETNPPAFPRDHRHSGHNGMNLRDWFAGQVIMGWRHSSVTHTHEHIAQEAYRTADAMLAARQDRAS